MHGEALLRVSAGPGGTTRIDEMRSSALVTLRRSGDGVYMVGAAATPIGGDRSTLAVELSHGARLRMRSSAALVSRRGPASEEARWSVRATVGPGASLWWEPEPTVVARGSNLVSEAQVELHDGARLLWRDAVVLGRFGEAPGVWSSSLDIVRGGVPLLRHQVVLGPDDGPALRAGMRALTTVAMVGAAPAARVVDHAWGRGAVMPLACGDGALIMAMGTGHHSSTALLEELLAWGEEAAQTEEATFAARSGPSS